VLEVLTVPFSTISLFDFGTVSTVFALFFNLFVCHSLATSRWFSPGPPVSSTNKTDRHDITDIVLKVALNIIKQTKTSK
jgi:hypothetical protein